MNRIKLGILLFTSMIARLETEHISGFWKLYLSVFDLRFLSLAVF